MDLSKNGPHVYYILFVLFCVHYQLLSVHNKAFNNVHLYKVFKVDCFF